MKYLFLVLALIAGCGPADPLGAETAAILAQAAIPEKVRFKEAQQKVAEKLRDPDSAKFRNLYTATTGYVCGEVNGKNAYGAYAGYTRFFYTSDGLVLIDDPEVDAVRFFCERRTK